MGEKQYHHGDLREDLIRKGIRLLAAEGYAGFSMRKLATLCDVSHAAPYKHFRSKDEIIFAIAQTISVEFNHVITEAMDLHPGNLRAQLIEIGKAYVRFMVENPDYFRFVFMTDHGRPIPLDLRGGVRVAENNPLHIVLKCAEAWFAPVRPEGWISDFMGLWSLLHGFTLMLVSQTVAYAGDYLALAEEMVKRYIGNAPIAG